MSENMINPHGLDLGKTLLGQKLALSAELIEARAEIARLREALQEIDARGPDTGSMYAIAFELAGIARAALSPQAQEATHG